MILIRVIYQTKSKIYDPCLEFVALFALDVAVGALSDLASQGRVGVVLGNDVVTLEFLIEVLEFYVGLVETVRELLPVNGFITDLKEV